MTRRDPSDERSGETATLLVTCPDRTGLVAALAQTLYGHGANILDADQHTDPVAGQFFQRIRFETAGLHTDRLTLERAIAEVAERLSMRWRLTYAGATKRVAIFVSRYDHCLVDLLLRHRAGEIECEIAWVASNHDTLQPLVEQFGVAFHHILVTAQTKAEAEAAQLALIERSRIDLVVLARYMQILSPGFLEQCAADVINIHHSFLPAFVGGKPYRRAYERGVKLIGATAHYATADLDEGPIIEQDVMRCSHRDHVADLMRKGRDLEKLVLARAVRWHLQDRVLICGNKTVVFD
ncbi:MAG: formyltetrahydrofolate deformylase [Myxococcales bacterium]|nr:formyltetrahydrofolate deformylase [Myxococcales bacterium]